MHYSDLFQFCFSFFINSNDSSKIDPIVSSLNNDDINGIRTGFDFNWSPSRIQDFQAAMNNARYEREFCSDERVS